MADILITVPKSVSWAVYQLELDAAAAGSTVNFKVSNFPRVDAGDRCYVVHDGAVRGWMAITGFKHDAFECEVTGKSWAGKFIQRSGRFHPVAPVAHVGFQGFRYVHRNEFSDV